MIEPVARCNNCFRDILSKELYTWADEGGRRWWEWQVLGLCPDCPDYALEELEEVTKDGC